MLIFYAQKVQDANTDFVELANKLIAIAEVLQGASKADPMASHVKSLNRCPSSSIAASRFLLNSANRAIDIQISVVEAKLQRGGLKRAFQGTTDKQIVAQSFRQLGSMIEAFTVGSGLLLHQIRLVLLIQRFSSRSISISTRLVSKPERTLSIFERFKNL